jgi:hypothetical protein
VITIWIQVEEEPEETDPQLDLFLDDEKVVDKQKSRGLPFTCPRVRATPEA